MILWLWACGLGIELEPAPEAPARLDPIEPLPAWSVSDACRATVFQERVLRRPRGEEGWRTLRGDLDGERGADEFRVLIEKGKDTTSYYFEIALDGRDWLRTSIVLSRSEMVHEIPFPEGANDAELALIEQTLFRHVCERPDPSLQLLVDDELRWYAGPPVLPPDYVVREAAQWRTYDGDSHESKGRLPVTYPRPLTETEQLRVVATGQGVIAQRDGAHAWLFVTRHHRNLRWPSEFSAKISGSGVEVTRHPTTMDEIIAPIVIFRDL